MNVWAVVVKYLEIFKEVVLEAKTFFCCLNILYSSVLRIVSLLLTTSFLTQDSSTCPTLPNTVCRDGQWSEKAADNDQAQIVTHKQLFKSPYLLQPFGISLQPLQIKEAVAGETRSKLQSNLFGSSSAPPD